MRVLGVDPSTYCIGLALLEDDELQWHEALKGQSFASDEEIGAMLFAYGHTLLQVIVDQEPDLAIIEFSMIPHGGSTVRKLAYVEAACMIAFVTAHLPYKVANVTNVRRRVLGKNMPKEDAAQMVRERLGKLEKALPTPRSKIEQYTFTDDEADAFILASSHWHQDPPAST